MWFYKAQSLQMGHWLLYVCSRFKTIVNETLNKVPLVLDIRWMEWAGGILSVD